MDIQDEMTNLSVYTISNEDLRFIVAQTPTARRVLTIAGSGDQALFYTLGGATHVDTFDRAFGARIIQDIKTTAIQHLEYNAFIEMMYNLSSIDIQKSIPYNVLNKLPDITRTNMPETMIFFNYANHNISKLPTATEFARLKATLHAPFNFIHENITNIHTRVQGPYVVINISNIFDHQYISDQEQQFQILRNIAPLLNVGGTIVYDNQNGRTYTQDKKFIIQSLNIILQYKSIQYKDKNSSRINRLDLFQRIR